VIIFVSLVVSCVDELLPGSIRSTPGSFASNRRFARRCSMQQHMIDTSDGRVLEVHAAERTDLLPIIFHSGTPTGYAPYDPVVEAAEAAGLRYVTYCRPGYGDSTPLPGRDIAQAATDTATILDALGTEQFVTAGWSGGGPHALACATLLVDRCLAAATIAGVGPDGEDDLDFTAGMGPENVEEFALAREGREAITPKHEADRDGMLQITGPGIIEWIGGLLPPVDRATLTDAFGEWQAQGVAAAVRHGVEGWVDDDLAFARPWGFDLRSIQVPVAVWQGDMDLMVPFAHGEWLASKIPGATPHLLAGEGHLSISVGKLGEIFADLAAAARTAAR
jgi:pimeloyl-ACP methyl ester carboxylesterase